MTRRAKQHPAAASHKGQEPCTKATLKPSGSFTAVCQAGQPSGFSQLRCQACITAPAPQQQARLQSKCLFSIVVPCES